MPGRVGTARRRAAGGGRRFGGVVRVSSEPKRILREGGRATGVEWVSGELFRAKHFVASSLNPQQTFLDLMDERDLPADWRARAAGFQYNLLAPLFALNVALAEAQRYKAAENGLIWTRRSW